MKQVLGDFKNCIVCDKPLFETKWYHNNCSQVLHTRKRIIDRVPDHIPREQEQRFLHRLYLREVKQGNERLQLNEDGY
jgi:hypothetical protein